MATSNLLKLYVLLVLVFSESSEASIQCFSDNLDIVTTAQSDVHMHCLLDEELRPNASFTLNKDGRELGKCSWTRCGNSSECNLMYKGDKELYAHASRKDMKEYNDAMNIQPANPSYNLKSLEPPVRPSPTCSMFLRKKDLSVDAVCEWSFVKEDMSVSLIIMNKTVAETVFYQEIRTNSSFPNRLVVKDKVFASFTLNELSSNIMPVTCFTSREKEPKSCRYPTLMEMTEDTIPAKFVCTRKGAVQIYILLIKDSNGQIIKVHTNQPSIIERNNGDETFVICGKEIDDVIEVNRIAKVELNQGSNCYTAETEHKADETIVTISFGCSPTYDNENTTTSFIKTFNVTEGGSTNSESQINLITETRINTTPITTSSGIWNEDKSWRNVAFLSILVVPVLICSFGTCLYLTMSYIKKNNTKNQNLRSHSFRENVMASQQNDNQLVMDTTRASLPDEMPLSRMCKCQRIDRVGDVNGEIVKTLNQFPVLPPRDTLRSSRHSNATGCCSVLMQRNTNTMITSAKSDRMCQADYIERNLGGTMERCQQDNLKNIQTSDETVYCTVNEVVVDPCGIKVQGRSVFEPSIKVPCDVPAVCDDFTTPQATRKALLPEETIFLNKSLPLPEGLASSPDDYCVYAKPKKTVRKSTFPIDRLNSSPCLFFNESDNASTLSSVCENDPKSSGFRGVKRNGDAVMEQAGYPSQGMRSSSEPNFCPPGESNSFNYASVKPSKLSYSVDHSGTDNSNGTIDIKISDTIMDHDLKSEEDTYSETGLYDRTVSTASSTYDVLQRFSFEQRLPEPGQKQ